jgi:hypothetical protein
MTVLVSDSSLATALANGLYDVDFSAATAVPSPAQTNVPVTLDAAAVGTAMVTTVQSMSQMMDAQASRLTIFATIFEYADKQLNVGQS